MTSDLDATTADMYQIIRDLWLEAQRGPTDGSAPPAGFGESVTPVPDTAIADASGLELTVVRDYLDNSDGVTFAVGRDGETRTVVALLTD